MRATIQWKDGWLCVAHESEDYNHPILRTLFYPILECSEKGAEYCYGPLPRLAYYRGDGHYCSCGTTFLLTEGGRTKPIACEEKAIPCPRVRKDVQVKWEFYCGASRWMKLTRKGWQIA